MLRKYKSLYVLSLLLLCIIWTPSTYGQSTQGANFANDQKVHAGISAAISAGLYISLKNSGYSRWSSFLGSFFLTLSVGAIKEITDDHVTEKDLVADTAGAFAGVCYLSHLIFKFYIFVLLLVPLNLKAEENLSEGGVSPHWEFSTTTGVSMPKDFEGVTEILPSVLYSLDKGFTYFRIEGNYLFASSEGVLNQRAYLCIKNYIDIADMKFYWRFGFGLTQYHRNTANFVDTNNLQSGGWHYAMGSKIDINKNVFIKADISAFIRPGRTIYVGIGLGFNFGDEGGSESATPK